MIPAEAGLVRIFVNSSDRWRGKPLYEAVVETARALHLAGASVFPVELSFGAHRRLRDAASDYLFAEIPVVIEIVDGLDRIDALLVELRTMIKDGLITVEPVRVMRYGSKRQETG
jgi:PII-like signaling protein